MSTLQLAFKAFDCHELLCHAVAEEAGLYAAQGLKVWLLDSTFIPDEALPARTLHAACGAALAGFLQGGSLRTVFVACDRPMFWLYGRPGLASLADLESARVATFPDVAPPARFLQKHLADEGLQVDLLPCRDDVARLGLLRLRSVDAALVSSVHLPPELQAEGLQPLAFIGDGVRSPSTGLAVPNALLEAEPEQVASMVGVYRQAMAGIFDDDRLLGHVLSSTFSMPSEHIGQAIETVRNCYNPSGRCDASMLQAAMDGAARALGVDSRPAGDFYRFDFLE